MKKIFTSAFAVALLLVTYTAGAQCTINTGNTTVGFTPSSPPCITQGAAYGEAVQIYIPSTINVGITVNIDSIKITLITGYPAGITGTLNPASGTIPGGGTGCIWYSGTTNAAPGTYPLTFRATAYIQGLGSIDTTLNAFGFSNQLSVCASTSCTINSGNTTDGFTPTNPPCATQGIAYGEAVQIHVPASINVGIVVNIDSIRITLITGNPAGIMASINPASATIPGGGNGCVWYSGTTNDPVGNYPLTYRITAYTMLGPVDTTLNAFGFINTLSVCAQGGACTINTGNTTNGFTPTNPPCATQGVAYGETVQLHVPNAINVGIMVNIDSIKVNQVTGYPAGITGTMNPASGVIPGGGNGCIWYSGTTNAAVGNYPLTYRVTAYTSLGAVDTTLNGFGFINTLSVCAASSGTCDTLLNLDGTDTLLVYIFTGTEFGYVSGNNSYGDLAKAEQFTAATGWTVDGAYLGFGYSTVAHPTDSVAVNVYANSGGMPGAILATEYVTLADIHTADTSGNLLYVPFNPAPTLTTGTFYVGIVLPDQTGDTIALLTNTGNNYNGKGWEQWSDNSWNDYATVYELLPKQQGNYIVAVACPSGTGAAPTAGFGANNSTSGCDSIVVNFQDQTIGGATSWLWSFPGGQPSSSNSPSPSVTYPAPGSYSVTLYVANANGSDTYTQTSYVNVTSSPTASTSTTNASGAVATDGSATVTPSGGTPNYTYHWNNNASSATASNLAPGTYTVTVTDSKSCTATASATVSFNSSINGVVSEKQARIFPNPATNLLNIEWTAKTNATILITDLSGRTVLQFATNGDLLNTFDISKLAAGTHILKITDSETNQQQSVRFDKF